MIDVTLLGTAALLPLPDRALTAAALSCAGHTILFDCGEGTQTAARKALRQLIAAAEHRTGGNGAPGENPVAGSERKIHVEDFVTPGQLLLQKLQHMRQKTVCD